LDPGIEVGHFDTSMGVEIEWRSAAWAAFSVAETVPVLIPSAVAIAW
jgi:hypothetical protein